MPIPTPFHPRTEALNIRRDWKEWGGYFTVCQYGVSVDPDYFAFRETAGMIDVTPLFKYEITGPDAQRFLDRVSTRDLKTLNVGRVGYGPWCDEQGKVLDDGNIFRWDEDRFWLTAAHPNFLWLAENAEGYDVVVKDISDQIAAVALQGPRSRKIVNAVLDDNIDDMGFFGCREFKIGKTKGWISRTGYTGDLGYELWVENKNALKLWDSLMEAGYNHNIAPSGMHALDIARIEAGYVMIDVDFRSSIHALVEEQKSTPYEIGLGWAVNLKAGDFIGRKALVEEHRKGPEWQMVGIEIDMEELEQMFDKRGLPVHLPCHAWRAIVPLYKGNKQVGYCSSGTWSPLLKKYVCLASVRSAYAKLGQKLRMDTLVDFDRERVTAVVTERPFYSPARMKSKKEELRPAVLASMPG